MSESNLKVGDCVKPTRESGFILASGCGRYPNAYVVSMHPFALCSEYGDMIWTATIKPEYFERLCQAHPSVMQICLTRWTSDQANRITALTADNARLRTRLLTAAGDDLCRLTQEEIKAYTSGAVQIPPEGEFIASCLRFHQQLAGTAGVLTDCLTSAQMAAQITAVEADNARLRGEVERLRGEANRRDAKWMAGIREACGCDKIQFDADPSDTTAFTLQKFVQTIQAAAREVGERT